MKTSHKPNASNNRLNRWALVVWVGFISACLLEGLVFSVVDPDEVHWAGHMLQPTRQGVYTAAFFFFWIISTASARIALWLAELPAEVNETAAD